MLYGSETWCLDQNEIRTLQQTEGAMVRSMYRTKSVDKKSTKDQMQMFALNEKIGKLAKHNSVRWNGHVLR